MNFFIVNHRKSSKSTNGVKGFQISLFPPLALSRADLDLEESLNW